MFQGGNFSCRHPKLWEYIKSNVKAFFITGAITFVVTASATTVKILHSRQVRYKNDKSVEQAINELYEKADECYGYHVGDEITVAGEQYYVIADSTVTQDYVVALKKDPLTVDEVNEYNKDDSILIDEVNGYGAIPFNSRSVYNTSSVKPIVDNWVNTIFINDELKTVDGYSSRLIKIEELTNLRNDNLSNWLYNKNYNYWTMSRWSVTNAYLLVVLSNGEIINRSYTATNSVRPVINVYKSAITKVNNN